MAPDVSTPQVVAALREWSGDPTVDAVLLQEPLPRGVDEVAALSAIAPGKDVDGACRTGRAGTGVGTVVGPTCSAEGILRLLDHNDVDPRGRDVVVIGDDPLLGRPVAELLIGRGATVTIVGPDSQGLSSRVRMADIVVASARRLGLVRGSWLKPGSVVVDAGYGQGLHGDVRRDEALEVVSLLAPVPGGVGPMTIAVLLERTVRMAERSRPPTGSPGGGEEPAVPGLGRAEGGNPACWAGHLCDHCGAVLDGGAHRPGCQGGSGA